MKRAKEERRRHPRVDRRIGLELRVGDERIAAALINLSETGVLVLAEKPVPRDAKVHLPIKLSPTQGCELTGRVVWSTSSAGKKGPSRFPYAMGVELSAVPKIYLQAVDKLRSHARNEAPRGPEERFDVFHQVRFQSGASFLTEYTENLSRGGMYLATTQLIEPGTIIRAKIDLPGTDEPIEVEGRVAYRLDPEAAADRGRTEGVGIQFVNLSPQVRERLGQYVQRLKVHRTSPERRFGGEIPSRGSLSDFIVPEILLWLLKENTTGVLSIAHRSVNKKVYVMHGQPVFVESSLPSESFSRFLFRQGLPRLEDMTRWLPLVDKRDMTIAKELVRMGLAETHEATEALVASHEERLTNSFSWFDGTFEFVAGTDWTESVSILPLQVHRIVFSGVLRWYDASLVTAWMGLNEDCVLARKEMPPAELALSPIAYQVLHELWTPSRVGDLARSLEVSVESLLPAAYALIISRWVDLQVLPKSEAQSERGEPPPEPTQRETEEERANRRKRIEEDFRNLKGIDFFKLLGVLRDAADPVINAAYEKHVSGYRSDLTILTAAQDEDAVKVMQILSWFRTARDTLCDPSARFLYQREQENPEMAGLRSFELERAILIAMAAVRAENLAEARASLEPYLNRTPRNASVLGWYAWVQFRQNPDRDADAALQLLEEALSEDPADSQLHFFQGEILVARGDWASAERAYRRAVRLQPSFREASRALERARQKVTQ